MKTTSAYILYTPLTINIEMEITGGGITQTMDGISGEYSPDRTLTPLVLKPKFIVKDVDGVLVSGDHTSSLTDIRWYLASDNSDESTRILSTNTSYVLGSNGALTVKANINPDFPQNLYFTCGYIDTRNQNTYRLHYALTLTATKATSVNLGLTIDALPKMPISPYRSITQRTVTATLYNGETVVGDADATYTWQVLDGGTWRNITDDDLFYVSGQGTKAITIDRAYIDKEVMRVQAYHNSVPDKVVSAQTKMYRWYGKWEERVCIVRGKYIRPETKEIEAKCIIETPKGAVTNPQYYFAIEHIYTTSRTNAELTTIGYGESVVVDADIVGKDATIIPVFGIEVKERTALRACTIEGARVTIDGAVLTVSQPKDDNEK